jgi:hypothetical protein
VALALVGLAAAATCRVLLPTVRTVQRHARRISLAQNLRAAASILPAELRGLDARDSDIVALSATSITIRALRQVTVLCANADVDPGTPTSLLTRDWSLFGPTGAFALGDSILVYQDGDIATRADDTWWRARVTAVSPEECPDPDHPRLGHRLTLDHQWDAARDSAAPAPTTIARGAPVRGFATVTYALYRSPSDGEWYLGQQEVPGTPQPLVGPLSGRDGLTFFYYDSAGASTTEATAVREIEVRVRGRTPASAPAGGSFYEIDSVVTRVALRNNSQCPRCP